MNDDLRIKLKHIGMLPSIIKQHERRIKARLEYQRSKQDHDVVDVFQKGLDSMRHNRRWTIRNNIRAHHLAFSFLRGQHYLDVEDGVGTDYGKLVKHILPKVTNLVNQHTSIIYTLDDIRSWVDSE